MSSLRNVPANTLLLLGILPTPKDLEIARLLGWYRIPMKSSPKVIEVDYLAFYQGANFGVGHRWMVEYIAEYRGHELTTRGELLRDQPDHPRAGEEYFKVQLGPLVPVVPPIKAATWKRITFLFTTGALFNCAETVNDLVVRDEERSILWRKLRGRTKDASAYKAGQSLEVPLSPEVIDLLLRLNNTIPDNDLENY